MELYLALFLQKSSNGLAHAKSGCRRTTYFAESKKGGFSQRLSLSSRSTSLQMVGRTLD
ncbi:hypothetical protein SLEP1_g24716 [Rubroshorea leprosula]|uniref:Uncharacterized protein n=1 Tax=Rubroshorea leprosula TaxID=152421 RepID=A0AAV5JR14_9ROSI|nr:hypothetical protein SLEP1_g24716 [Rubroshorea leprosula]